MAEAGQVVTLPLSSVWSKQQHRHDFPADDIERIASSIAAIGLLQPIEVEPGEKHGGEPGTFCITDGECRFRACVKAGLDTVRAFVVESASEADRLARQATANLARVPLSPMAKARAVGYHFDQLREEKPWLTEEDATREAAVKLGVSPQFAFGKLGLRRLPDEVQAMLDKEPADIGERAALALLPLMGKGQESEAHAVDLARAVRSGRLLPAAVSGAVSVYLGEQAQGSLFGAEVARESQEAKETKSVLSKVLGHLERVSALTFDDEAQEYNLGSLRNEDLAMAEAKLLGGLSYLQRLIAGVQEAQGKTPDLHAETVVPRPAETQQAPPAVVVAQEGEGQVPTPQNAPQRPTVRQAVLTEPERVEFGGEVRVATVGTWLWVYGVPERGSLAYQLQKAGARWAAGRRTWYSPRPDEQARIQEVLREYLSATTGEAEPEETAALEAAG